MILCQNSRERCNIYLHRSGKFPRGQSSGSKKGTNKIVGVRCSFFYLLMVVILPSPLLLSHPGVCRLLPISRCDKKPNIYIYVCSLNNSHRLGLRNTAELPHIRLEAGKPSEKQSIDGFLPSGKPSGNHLEKHRNHLETPTFDLPLIPTR